MKNLFIIGNGFDLSHGIESKYEHFHQYLEESYPDFIEDIGYIPESSTGQHGEEVYDDDEGVGLIVKLISNVEGDEWSDVESSLASIDISEFLDDCESDEEDDDDEPSHKYYNNEDNSQALANAVLNITDYFSDWINEIQIENAKPKKDFCELINKDNDAFLTFNYTNTLEYLYGVKNICHIHGKQGEKLLFGHGDDSNKYTYHLDEDDSYEDDYYEDDSYENHDYEDDGRY